MRIERSIRAADPLDRNGLLDGLNADDAAMLRPHLAPLPLRRGERILAADERVEMVYFPRRGLLSVGETVAGRGSVEIAIVGSEGMVGWPALLGCGLGAHDVIVQGNDGSALAMPSRSLVAACAASATLHTAMLGFVQSVMGQMARTIASNVRYPLERRIARWLLMRDDRLRPDQIFVRHDEIADALSVRRASVTDHLHTIEGERLIRCRRGRISLRDRPALEAFCGGAYGPADVARRVTPHLLAS